MHKQFSGVLWLSHLYTDIENDVIDANPMCLFVKYKYAQTQIVCIECNWVSKQQKSWF